MALMEIYMMCTWENRLNIVNDNGDGEQWRQLPDKISNLFVAWK